MATFYAFPRPPFGLRGRIWEMTLEPRTIVIRVKSQEWRIDSGGEGAIDCFANLIVQNAGEEDS
jgi:hypothetical protein